MSFPDDDNFEDEILTTVRTEQVSKLFCELEHSRKDERMHEIEEMNRLIGEMNGKEFRSVFTKELFNEMEKKIKKKKISLKDSVLILQHVGYCKILKNILRLSSDNSSLNERLKKWIVDEDKKKEKKDEKLLADLCKCYLTLRCKFEDISEELLSICLPCLLKVALNKEKNEETQKEVEEALLALSCVAVNTVWNNSLFEALLLVFQNFVRMWNKRCF
ncbi:uncharacterized protein MONOS_18592 [Monocercomonoides exilis]|uniref:uncharacterized protein n=1 Tax=Monocercomonoides exilis TaxID=2049356 RepID=UPI00355A59BB|nr:hypothetical protein MONOS_18592 [Monocercomonoides exilis]